MSPLTLFQCLMPDIAGHIMVLQFSAVTERQSAD